MEATIAQPAPSDRAAAILRRWRRVRSTATPRRWEDDRHFAQAAAVLCLPLLLALPLDGYLLTGEPGLFVEPPGAQRVTAPFWWIAFAAVVPVNGWLLESLLRRRRAASPPPALSALRFLAASVPVFGFAALPLLGRWPASGTRRAPLFLRAWFVRLDRWTRCLEGTVLWVGWLFGVNLALLLGWVAWLVRPEPAPDERRALIWGITVLLHGASAAAALHHLPLHGWRRRKLQRAWGWVGATLALLPAPLAGPSMVTLLLAEQQRHGGTLAGRAAPGSAEAGALPHWRRVETSGRIGSRRRRRRWPWRSRGLGDRRPALAESPRLERRFLSFLRLRHLVAFFEAQAVGWGMAMAGLGGWLDRAGPLVESAWLAILGATGGAALLDLARRVTGRPGRYPWRELWSVVAALVVVYHGLLVGRGLALGDGSFLTPLLYLATAGILGFGAPILLLPAVHREHPRGEDLMRCGWAGMCFALLLAVAAAAHDAQMRVALGRSLGIGTAVAPVLLGLVLYRGVPPLVHPFSWRDGLPGQGRPVRWLVAVLVFTAVVPLGVLAAPLWIRARRHLLPRWELRVAASVARKAALAVEPP